MDRLNELQQTLRAACARGGYPQEDGEPHWAIVRRINDLRREQQVAICQRAATVLLDLEDVLPLDKIEALEREISPTSVRRTCQGIVTAAKYLNEHRGPAPAGWPRSSDGDTDVLLDDSVINELAMQVKEMQQEIAAVQEVALHTLLKQICEKKRIKINTWLQNHHFNRTSFMDWKAAGGKPVKGKVSVAKAQEFEAAVLRDAKEISDVTAEI